MRMWDVQLQSGASDCGLFSISFAVCLCQGKDPCSYSWTQELMRKHLTACWSNQRMSLFPGKSRKVSAGIRSSIHLPVFCFCRMLENKIGMFQCTRCEEWIHKKCRDIPRAVLRNVSLHGFVMNVCKNFLSSFSITDKSTLRVSMATLFS